MDILASILVLIIALEHIYILYLEMFLWAKPKGRKIFGMSEEQAEATKVLAANQGLYNGFLAAGLLWGLIYSNPETAYHIQLFFTVCVLVAGLYGGATASKVIYKVQALPAFITLVVLLASGYL